jgi:hypothetical protein
MENRKKILEEFKQQGKQEALDKEKAEKRRSQ